jgi:hypothetical protein
VALLRLAAVGGFWCEKVSVRCTTRNKGVKLDPGVRLLLPAPQIVMKEAMGASKHCKTQPNLLQRPDTVTLSIVSRGSRRRI